jgi:hypothetical protein
MRCYTLGDGIIHSHCCENLKSNCLAKLNSLNIKADNIYAREVKNGNRTAVMNVIGFLYVSLCSSTFQLHDSLGNRLECANSGAGFGSQNGERA